MIEIEEQRAPFELGQRRELGKGPRCGEELKLRQFAGHRKGIEKRGRRIEAQLVMSAHERFIAMDFSRHRLDDGLESRVERGLGQRHQRHPAISRRIVTFQRKDCGHGDTPAGASGGLLEFDQELQ